MTTLENPTGPGAKKAKALGIAGILALAFAWLRDGFAWIPSALFSNKYMMGLESSLMLLGSGFFLSLRVAAWMLVASLLTWGVFAPMLLANGIGLETARTFGMEAALEKGLYYPVIMRWTMWPATVLMASHGLASLFLKWKSIVGSIKSLMTLSKGGNQAKEFSIKPILTGIFALTAVLAAIQFFWLGINPAVTVLAVLISLPIMLIGVRVNGETGLAAVSPFTSLTQLIFGAITPGNIAANMASSGTTGSITAASEGMMDDLKVSHTLGGKPKAMTIAQIIGAVFGAIMLPLVYPILRSVYGFGPEGLPAPTVHKWKGLAELLNQGWSNLPSSSVTAMLVALVAGVALAGLEKRWPKWAPSAVAIGAALLLPSQIVLPIALGGILAWLFSKSFPSKSATYLVPLGAGFIAGEAIMALVIPLLKLAGIVG